MPLHDSTYQSSIVGIALLVTLIVFFEAASLFLFFILQLYDRM